MPEGRQRPGALVAEQLLWLEPSLDPGRTLAALERVWRERPPTHAFADAVGGGYAENMTSGSMTHHDIAVTFSRYLGAEGFDALVERRAAGLYVRPALAPEVPRPRGSGGEFPPYPGAYFVPWAELVAATEDAVARDDSGGGPTWESARLRDLAAWTIPLTRAHFERMASN